VGWVGYPYWFWWRYRGFPWIPWWTGLYGPMMPYTMIPKEQEIAMLESQERMLEDALKRIRERLEELRKPKKVGEET